VAISDVNICNMALGHLGKRSINALTEGSANAQACALIYANTRDAMLRVHSWNFNTKELPLALIADEEVLGWTYLYAYPANCLFVQAVYNELTLDTVPTEPFKELLSPTTSQRAIACDTEDAYAEINIRVTDPTLFDLLFVEALSFELAARLAVQLTGDQAIARGLEAKALQTIDRAKLTNANEGTSAANRSSKYLSARG
jgi:hypothetical protein